jgi:pimeloyl-ACP methyl ester carboxylesterase
MDLVILVHGWCMNHQHWYRSGTADLGRCLQMRPNTRVLYLNYNSGRHISHNGQSLNQLLEKLVQLSSGRIRTLTLIGHSMGGLILRSACHYAEQTDSGWLLPLHKIIYLGSPHHGSPVAKAFHLLTAALRQGHVTQPLAMGQYLSAGLKDLRFGNLLDEDWQGVDQDDLIPDQRRPVPLSQHAQHYFLAAAVGQDAAHLHSLALGDLLVRMSSATGRHREPERTLQPDPKHCRVLTGVNHFDLIGHPATRQQIFEWLDD